MGLSLMVSFIHLDIPHQENYDTLFFKLSETLQKKTSLQLIITLISFAFFKETRSCRVYVSQGLLLLLVYTRQQPQYYNQVVVLR